MKFMRALLLAAMLPVTALAAWQPDSAKPVTVVIGFQPGSGNEVGFRAISAIVQKNHPDVKFVIELKPGADSTVAQNYLYEAKPDGYTLGVPSYMGTFVTNDIWQKDIKKFQYNSFTNIIGLGKSPLVFVANAKSKINTPEELIKLVQSPDRNITFAGGAGAHLMTYKYFMHKARGNNDKVKFAPHQGPLQAVTSVAGDTGMEFGIMPISVALPLIQAGKVKPIAITGNRRLEQFPQVPVMRVGGGIVNIYAAWALVLPPNAPKEVVKWYHDAFLEAIRSPEIKKWYYDNLIFVEDSELSPEGFSKAIEDLRSVWIPFSQQVNLVD